MERGVTVEVVFLEVRLAEVVFDTDLALTHKRLVVVEADSVAVQDMRAGVVVEFPFVTVGDVQVAVGIC